MSKQENSTAEVENFRLSQLGDFGIVVNPQWTVSSLQPEDLYLINFEAVQKVVGSSSSSSSAKKSNDTTQNNNKAALISWIKENAADNAETVFSQAVSDIKSLPKKLPGEAKSRFEACSTLTQVLKSIFGVPDHLDYSVFMYPSEKKTRESINCLLERLADHQDRVRQESSSSSTANQQQGSRSTSAGEALSIAAIFSKPRSGAAFGRPDARRLIKTSNKAITSIKKPDQVVSTSLRENGLRRYAQLKNNSSSSSSSSSEAPAWVVNHLKAINKNFDEKNSSNKKSAADLMYGSLADVAPQQAAAQEKAAAELQAKLRSQEADVEKMKLSVEDAQKARETEDADLTEKLKTLKSGIKHFKNIIKSAKGEMEELEKHFLSLENNEADLARLEAQLAEIASRRAIIDGVDKEGDDFVATLQAQLDEVEADHAGLLNDIQNKLNKQKKKQRLLKERILSMGPTKKDQLQQLQGECKSLGQECRVKLEEYENLDTELERSKAKTKIKLDREVLSRMIYDVTVRRHAKQEEQIQSLVNEIGLSDRRITDLSNAISKRYGEIENNMYDTAQVDAQVRDLFSPMVGLRGEYVNLVKRISELGKVRKETHDVESRLNKLMRFSDSSMLASAERDLQLVTESIASVQHQIEELTKGASSSAVAVDSDAI